MRTLLSFCFLFCTQLLLSAEETPAKIELTPVTVAQLNEEIASYKGKVVVVDLWAEFCIPCRKKFPQMVRLHNELSEKGLVMLSVTIDEKEDAGKALEFLKHSKATFRNLHLIDSEEKIDQLQPKLATKAVPIVHVFDREGKKTSFETGIKDDEVEKLIRELLKK